MPTPKLHCRFCSQEPSGPQPSLAPLAMMWLKLSTWASFTLTWLMPRSNSFKLHVTASSSPQDAGVSSPLPPSVRSCILTPRHPSEASSVFTRPSYHSRCARHSWCRSQVVWTSFFRGMRWVLMTCTIFPSTNLASAEIILNKGEWYKGKANTCSAK